jgi:MFS family permease
VKELANTFDKPLVSTLWVNTVYLVISAASQLFFTMMCDVFSHGPLWIIAGVLSTIGSGVCGGSMSLTELIIGRLVQGIGGGGATALCWVIMADTTPESIHSRYSCYILLTRLIGSMLGPAVGGIFIDKGNWTWACYFNFVFCGLGLLLIPLSVDLRVSKNIPLRKLRILDWSGATMALLGPSSILIGLGWGGILYRWLEWRTLMPIAVGVATLIALVLYESMWALHPQFGAKVFRSPAAIMTYVGCFCHGFVVSQSTSFHVLLQVD